MVVEHRVEDVLAICPEVVLYMEDGRVTYFGDVNGLMEIADYHEVKLPAAVVLKKARKDPPPAFLPVIAPKADEKPLVRFEDVHFRYGKDTRMY